MQHGVWKKRVSTLLEEVKVTIGAKKPVAAGLKSYANSENIC
jgi:hypothetical protein